MRFTPFILASTAVIAVSFPVSAADSAAQAKTVKPVHFSELGGVKGWRRGDKDTIVYVQVADSSWYRVDLYETCMKFVNEKGLRFITEEEVPGQRLSKVIADKYICTVLEMTKVDAPSSSQAAK